MRDRLELLAGLVGHERALGERGAVERTVGPQDLGAELLDQRASAGVPGSTTFRAIVSASITTAPRSTSIRGDRRLARPDAAREPDHEHAAPSLRVAFTRRCARRTASGYAPHADKARDARREQPGDRAGGATVARRNRTEGFGRLAAALASSDEAAPRIETASSG